MNKLTLLAAATVAIATTSAEAKLSSGPSSCPEGYFWDPYERYCKSTELLEEFDLQVSCPYGSYWDAEQGHCVDIPDYYPWNKTHTKHANATATATAIRNARKVFNKPANSTKISHRLNKIGDCKFNPATRKCEDPKDCPPGWYLDPRVHRCVELHPKSAFEETLDDLEFLAEELLDLY